MMLSSLHWPWGRKWLVLMLCEIGQRFRRQKERARVEQGRYVCSGSVLLFPWQLGPPSSSLLAPEISMRLLPLLNLAHTVSPTFGV